jgi:pimeloyl-ACP methyl ester carboxylesterase
MNTFWKMVCSVGLGLIIFCGILMPLKVSAATHVSGQVSADTTWTLENSPYVLDNSGVEVTASSTLTIEPGVIIKSTEGALVIKGTLKAIGTPDHKIIFTSLVDDVQGGDTNEDGEDSIPENNDPWGIVFLSGKDEQSQLKDVEISYSGQGLVLNNSSVSFDNVVVQKSGLGINAFGSTVTLKNSSFQDIKKDPLYFYDHSIITIASTTLDTFTGTGITAFNNSFLSLLNVVIQNNTKGTAIKLYDSSQLSCGKCTLTNIHPNSGGSVIEIFKGSTALFDAVTIDSSIASSYFSVYDTSGISTSTLRISHSIVKNGSGSALTFYGMSDIALDEVKIDHFTDSAVIGYGSSHLSILGSDVQHSKNGLYLFQQVTGTMASSTVANNTELGIFASTLIPFSAQNNWWGTSTGPYNATLNQSGGGNPISDLVDFIPWLTSDGSSKPECCSSVLFLPGIKASRLYTKDRTGEHQLWEPQLFGDSAKLTLNQNQQSAIPVYTRDIIDSTNYAAFNKDIYQKFTDALQTMVRVGTIHSWTSFPYDWRFDVENIAKNGTFLSSSTKSKLIQAVKQLVASSTTGKVTLVAHSNGGLLAKAFVQFLEETHQTELIDKVILVATPQLGTPAAITSLLHGYGEGLPWGILNPSTARSIALTFPSAYGLLPSQAYLQNPEPLVFFDQSIDTLSNLRKVYGNAISSYGTLNKFLLGTDDKRSMPDQNDLVHPAKLTSSVLKNAETIHHALDAYTFPNTIKLYQIVGNTIPTLNSIRYSAVKDFTCLLSLCTSKDILDYSPGFTETGDGVVQRRSAASTPATTFFVDIAASNNANQENRRHADILEMKSVEDLVANILKNDSVVPSFISMAGYENHRNTFQVSVHSPVALNIYDGQGRHTGPRISLTSTTSQSDMEFIDEQIPNSYYMPFGEGVYAGGDLSSTSVKLLGTGMGTFTFSISKTIGGIATTTTFEDIPVLPTTEVTAQITQSQTPPILHMDMDGDGKEDIVISSGHNLTALQYIDILKAMINNLSIKDSIKNQLIKKLDKLADLIRNNKITNPDKLLRQFLRSITNHGIHRKIVLDSDIASLLSVLAQLFLSLKIN